MPLYEYQCKNQECPNYDKVIEIQVKLSQYSMLLHCEKCGQVLKKLISKLKTKHGSWSNWQIG